MVFNYKLTDKENGNYAIRRKDAKGREARKAIEAKNNRQTSENYFFLYVDKNDTDSTYNLFAKINPILKTITYEYVYRGTDKKSFTKYLTKKDIDNVFQNIEEYKNQTIRIENAPSKLVSEEKEKLLKRQKDNYKKLGKLLEDSYREGVYEKMLNLVKIYILKENEFKKKKLEAETEIRRLNREICRIKNITADFEKATNAENEKYKKLVFNFLKKEMKNLSYTENDDVLNFPVLFNDLYNTAKNEIKREKANERQGKYRERKTQSKSKKV